MTDEQIVDLMSKLRSVQPNRWFKITGREDAADILQVVKLFIDMSRWGNSEDDFVLHNDYGSFMRKVHVPFVTEYHKLSSLPAGVTLKKHKAKRNYVWESQEEFI